MFSIRHTDFLLLLLRKEKKDSALHHAKENLLYSVDMEYRGTPANPMSSPITDLISHWQKLHIEPTGVIECMCLNFSIVFRFLTIFSTLFFFTEFSSKYLFHFYIDSLCVANAENKRDKISHHESKCVALQMMWSYTLAIPGHEVQIKHHHHQQ